MHKFKMPTSKPIPPTRTLHLKKKQGIDVKTLILPDMAEPEHWFSPGERKETKRMHGSSMSTWLKGREGYHNASREVTTSADAAVASTVTMPGMAFALSFPRP